MIVLRMFLIKIQLSFKNREKIPAQQSRGKYFSMDQFRRFYNTCRIPMKKQDRLDVHFRTGKLWILTLF